MKHGRYLKAQNDLQFSNIKIDVISLFTMLKGTVNFFQFHLSFPDHCPSCLYHSSQQNEFPVFAYCY